MNQPDELDPLLRRFFQAQMPSPWPDCPVPDEPARAVVVPEKPASSWLELSQRFASRLALALSLLLLVGAAWSLSGAFLTPPAPTAPSTNIARDNRIEIVDPTAEHKGVNGYKVNERFVQPKKDETEWKFDIHKVEPSTPRR
jgi:hypothetical protein